VKGRTLENFWLAAKLREAGVAIRCCGGKGALSFRMYPNGLRELVEGWTKGFASGAAQTPLVILLLIIAWLTGMMSAFVSLALKLLRSDFAAAAQWGALYVLFAAQLQLMLRQIGSFRWYAAWFYPAPLIFYFAVFTRSLLRRRSSQTVTWKGREIRAD
jgi:4,4'-diaponeurosporenoate glycosyltransferase